MKIFSIFFLQNLWNVFAPVGVFLITIICGLIIRKLISILPGRAAERSKVRIGHIIIQTINGPSVIWIVMLGIYFALEFSKLPPNIIHLTEKSLLALGILSITFVSANIATKLVGLYSRKLDTALPITSLTQNISRIIIFTTGTLVMLHSLGISITPILTTLGVGGLAIALALQDTLSNLFAGLHIIISKQVKVGDYIKLDSGEEGYVMDITWRTTKIRMLPNNIILVPNEKLTKAIVTNYYLPEKEMDVSVNLGVHYNSDLKKVERITCETAKEVMKETAGGVPEFEPFIRYNSFGDSSINFTVVLRTKEFAAQYLIKHEFIKKLHERYAAENIMIPYPVRAINYAQEKSGAGL